MSDPDPEAAKRILEDLRTRRVLLPERDNETRMDRILKPYRERDVGGPIEPEVV